MKGVFRRHGNLLVPAGKDGKEAIEAIKEGARVVIDVRASRNPSQHALFWALCDLVAEATDSAKEAVKEWLLEQCGFVDLIFYPDGSMKVRPKSIAWESMEQAEFNSFFRLAVPKIADLLGSAPKEVWKRFEDMLDSDTRAETRKRFKRIASPPTVPASPEHERAEA